MLVSMAMQIMKLLYHSVRSVWIPLPQKTSLNGHTMPTLKPKDLSSPIYMLYAHNLIMKDQ